MEWGETTLYRVLNEALRSENRQELKIWFKYIKLFDSGLNKLPVAKEVIWRGVPIDIGKNYSENQTITWWSVNSCSSSVNVIKDFLRTEQHSTLFLIEALNGVKISGYTEYENENEVILRIGTQFRVKSNALDHPNGSHVVHLIETDQQPTPTPTPKPQPPIPKPTNENQTKSVRQQIIDLLILNENEKQDEILNDLFTNGVQSLTKYQDDLFPDIYDEFIVKESVQLTECLKSYYEQQWRV